MRMTDLISKKRDGGELSTEEISFMIKGYTGGEIPDYQMSAMCMAILFRGMNDREILDLTMAMMHSGDVMDLSAIEGIKAESHRPQQRSDNAHHETPGPAAEEAAQQGRNVHRAEHGTDLGNLSGQEGQHHRHCQEQGCQN